MDPSHTFQPLAVETLGAFGPNTATFLKDLGRRIRQTSGEEKSFPYLVQRLAVAIQRGNTASVMGTLGRDLSPDDFFQ